MGGSLSLVPVLDYFARRECVGAGLRQNAVTLPYPDGGAGATCTVQYWAPPGEPRLPPLLLVHGFGPRADWQWRCQVGPLSRHFHVIVPDLLGFGGSSYPSETAPPPTEATQAAALAALLDALPGMEGRRVAVAGTSYGGFVAYWLAREAGAARVGPVVIASSDLLKTAADDRAFLKRAGEGWGGVDEILLPAEPAALRKLLELASCRPPPRLMTPDFLLRDIIQKLFTENRERLVHLLKGITVGTDKFQVTPISQDVLIVWGDHDQLFPVEKAFAVQRSLNGSARLEVLKKTGHAPQLEDPARFNKVMLDFLLASHKPDDPSKLFTDNRERLVHLLKGITVGTDKFQVTPISQDVLIVWGDHDQLFPVEKAFAVQRALNGSARLEVLKKTGHAPQLEDPARFNKVMLDFLLASHKPDDPSVSGSSQ